MASRKTIFEIEYHYDDDTGMYEIGEIDCGLGEDLIKFAKNYGTDDLIHYLTTILPKRILDFLEADKKYKENNPQ